MSAYESKGIKFHSLENAGHYIYIIEVDQSFYTPHQFRNIYYMRIDGQTKPAPHHYIEALFHKITFPKLEGYIKIDSIKTDGQRFIVQVSNMIFNKSKIQNEHNIYYRVIVTVGKFAQFGIYTSKDKIYTMEGHELRVNNAKSTLYYDEPLMNSEIIVFNPFELNKENNECEIMLFFGGEKSPLMISEYKLKIETHLIKDLNKLIITMNENKYSFENSDKSELSETDKMKIILDMN